MKREYLYNQQGWFTFWNLKRKIERFSVKIKQIDTETIHCDHD